MKKTEREPFNLDEFLAKEYLEDIFFKQQQEKRRQRIKERRERERKEKIIVGISVLSFMAIGTLLLYFPLPKKNIPFMPAVETTTEQENQLAKTIEPVILILETESSTPEDIILETESPALEEVANPYSEEEILLLKQILAAESYSFWGYDDLLSLGTVIFNRIESEEYPNTLLEVLTQPIQFETYSNGRYMEVEITDACEEAVEALLAGERNLNKDVLFFCTEEYYNSSPEDDFFRTLKHVYTCRNVYFFEK